MDSDKKMYYTKLPESSHLGVSFAPKKWILLLDEESVLCMSKKKRKGKKKGKRKAKEMKKKTKEKEKEIRIIYIHIKNKKNKAYLQCK